MSIAASPELDFVQSRCVTQRLNQTHAKPPQNLDRLRLQLCAQKSLELEFLCWITHQYPTHGEQSDAAPVRAERVPAARGPSTPRRCSTATRPPPPAAPRGG